MATIVLGSYAVQFPMGGYLAWVLQWLVGLDDLGHDVWFVERSHFPGSCFDPLQQTMGDDCTFGTHAIDELLRRHGLDGRWCYIDAGGEYHGQPRAVIDDVLHRSELFIDMGTHGTWDREMRWSAHRAYIDGEPGFTQFRWATDPKDAPAPGAFDRYFTVGQNVGRPNCLVPTCGIDWVPVLYPVVPRMFPVVPAAKDAPFTTIMSWSARDQTEFEGATYGSKDLEFPKFLDLPRHVASSLELAVTSDAPRDLLAAHGWRTRDAHEASITFDTFCNYVRSSRGEFGVCKNGFVATRSGWVGDRLGVYLASGRPVVMQDTGFSDHLPCGEGLFAVASLEEAAAAIDGIDRDYERHSAAARGIAEEYFAADGVLRKLLSDVGIESKSDTTMDSR